MTRPSNAVTVLVAVVIAVLGVSLLPPSALAAAPPTPLGSQSPQTVTLRVSTHGGFTPAGVAAPPEVTVYRDGQVLTLDTVIDPVPDPAADPSAAQQDVEEPALPGLTQRTLTPEALGRLLAAVRAAGLAENSYSDASEPDAGVTVISVALDDLTYTSSFSGFGPRASDSPAVADRRARAEAFLTALRDLPALAGPDGVSAPAPWESDRFAVSVRPARGGIDPEIKDWPARDIELAALARAAGCTVLGDSAALALRGALRGEDAATHWSEGGRTWRIYASPLLPDQSGCPAT
ncbi:MAG: hypothetical protein ACT4P1_10340 [Sporichthyaceae bacterium]